MSLSHLTYFDHKLVLTLGSTSTDTKEQLKANLLRDPRNPPSQRVQGDMVPDVQPARFTRRLEVHNRLIVE